MIGILSALYGAVMVTMLSGLVLIGSRDPALDVELESGEGAANLLLSLHDIDLIPAQPFFPVRIDLHDNSTLVLEAFETLAITPLPVPLYDDTAVVTAASVVTPVPAPVPVPAQTHTSCPALVVDAFSPYGAVWEACVISFCESRWVSQTGDHGASEGWFQIQPRWHQAKADALFGAGADLMDPTVNVATAVVIFLDSGWSLWTTNTALASGVCPHGAVYPG